MIYTLGNSHAHFFTDSHPGELGWGKQRNEHFISYSANFHNPSYRHVLAHKFMERFFPYFIRVINSINITKNDHIMFIVGEIDCRWHIPKKVTNNVISPEEIISLEMDYFFPAIAFLLNSGYNVIGWGSQPSTTKGHSDDPDNPIYGTCLFRNEITRKWNSELEKRCESMGIPYISIFDQLIDGKTYHTDMKYFYDDYHLNPLAYPLVISELKTKGVLQ